MKRSFQQPIRSEDSITILSLPDDVWTYVLVFLYSLFVDELCVGDGSLTTSNVFITILAHAFVLLPTVTRRDFLIGFLPFVEYVPSNILCYVKPVIIPLFCNIRRLNIDMPIDNEPVRAILQCMKSVEKLEISFVPLNFMHIREWPNLRSLTVGCGCILTIKDESCIPLFERLETLKFYGCQDKDIVIPEALCDRLVTSLTNLRSLSLSGHPAMFNRMLTQLPGLTKISDTNFTNIVVDNGLLTRHLSRLKILTIGANTNVTSDGGGLAVLAPTLKSLKFYATTDGLNCISMLTNLTRLTITRNTHIGAEQFVALTQLKELSIKGTGTWVQYLRLPPQLETLTVGHRCPYLIDDVTLYNLTCLKTLVLHNPVSFLTPSIFSRLTCLTTLTCNNVAINDNTLKDLSGLRNLVTKGDVPNLCTDVGISTLLPNLQRLSIANFHPYIVTDLRTSLVKLRDLWITNHGEGNGCRKGSFFIKNDIFRFS